MANYRNLIANALGQGARSTKWDIHIPTDDSKVTDKFLSVLCKDVTIPGLRLSKISKKYKGKEISVSGQVSYDSELSLTFLCDENHYVKQFFEEWMLKFDSRGFEKSFLSNNRTSYFRSKIVNESNLYKDIKIYQYSFDTMIDGGEADKPPLAEYNLYGCFPTSVSGLSMGNDSESILEVKVTMSFVYYEREDE